jgi:hypothetical protein
MLRGGLKLLAAEEVSPMYEPGPLTTPSLQRRLSRRRIRLLLVILVGVPLCLTLLVVYVIHFAGRQLQEAIAEADRLDPGWRMTELQAKRAAVPDAQNAALIVAAAHNLLPTRWPSPTFDAQHRSAFSRIEPPVQLDEGQTKVLREELGRVEQVLMLLHQVRDRPTGRYPKPIMLFAAMEVGKVLAYEAVLRAQDKDLHGALASCHCILNCGRASGDEPAALAPLVRVHLNRLATWKVERTLAQGEASEAALASIQHELAQEMEQPLLLRAARGARAEIDERMQAIENGELDPRTMVSSDWTGQLQQLLYIPGVRKGTRASLLKSNNALVEVAKLPVEEQAVRLKQLQADKQQTSALSVDRVFAQFSGRLAELHPNQAELRCAVVMVAVERFRRANQRWPRALRELVPGYLSQVPLDPFDAAPLRYARREDGVVIYSIGPDGQDNGGTLDKNPHKVGADVGFRLWNVPQRRQPPKPPKQSDGGPSHERDSDS